MKHFILTKEHVALLKRMKILWEDGAYEGAPSVDIKRPYGNSTVWMDVAEAIWLTPTADDDGEKHWPAGTRDKCLTIHREMTTALQVCLAAQSFEPGGYVSDEYRDNWRKAACST